MIPSCIKDSQSSRMIRNLPDNPPGQTDPTEEDLEIGRDIFLVSTVTKGQLAAVSRNLKIMHFYILTEISYHDSGHQHL